MKVWIGTSGFQYPEWKGKFYPEDLSASKMLGFYSARFGTTEVNYSFRRIPSPAALERWAQATPDAFKFSFKAPQKVTHFARLRNCGEVLGVFAQVLFGMGEKLGVVLFQLPPNFAKDLIVLSDFLPQVPAGLRVAFEFRHTSWFDDNVFETLRTHNTELCIAESEELEIPRIVTADFGYLRTRREDYTEMQIRQWAEFVESQRGRWGEAFIYFKHEERAVGPKFASQLAELLLPVGN